MISFTILLLLSYLDKFITESTLRADFTVPTVLIEIFCVKKGTIETVKLNFSPEPFAKIKNFG